MNRQEALASLTFGNWVAETEASDLGEYFVQTDQWVRVYKDEVDLIFGSKGTGKSAIYSLIRAKKYEFRKRGIEVLPAETVRDHEIFRRAKRELDTSDFEFGYLWKLFIVIEIAKLLRETGLKSKSLKELDNVLTKFGLLKPTNIVQWVKRQISSLRASSFEYGIKINPMTGEVEGLTGKLSLADAPSRQDDISVSRLIELTNSSLEDVGRHVWVLLDRLDAAFDRTIETNALRGLFRTYIDLFKYDHLRLKIFLRPDIWDGITAGHGFREASHMARQTRLEWNQNSLLNLIVKRALHSKEVKEFYGVESEAVLMNTREQAQFLYSIIPAQVDPPSGLPTLEWILSQCSNAMGECSPREVIHLLSSSRDRQLKMYEVGAATVDWPQQSPMVVPRIIDSGAILESVSDVSREQYEQMLCAEFPSVKPFVAKLERSSIRHTLLDVAELWAISLPEALQVSSTLAKAGFWRQLEPLPDPVYEIANVYWSALKLTSAESEGGHGS